MFALGIDPGLSRCGYGAVRTTPSGPRAEAIGVLRTSPDRPLPARLAELQAELRSLIAELQPDVVAVERVFFQNNARTAIGVALITVIQNGLNLLEVSTEYQQIAVGVVFIVAALSETFRDKQVRRPRASRPSQSPGQNGGPPPPEDPPPAPPPSAEPAPDPRQTVTLGK